MTPEQVLGLERSTERTSIEMAQGMTGELKQSVGAPTSAVGFAWDGGPATADLVPISAAVGQVRNRPATVLKAIFGAVRLPMEPAPVDPGTLGGHASCGTTDKNGRHITMCVWVDQHSIGVVRIYSVSARDRTRDFVTIRSVVERAGG